MKTKIILASSVLLACACSTQAFAYNFIDYCGSTPVRWSGSAKTMSASQASFPSGSDWYSNYQYSSTGSGNSETVTITSPPSGFIYLSLHAAPAFSGVTISTEY